MRRQSRVPVPAPDGMKWVLSKTHIYLGGGKRQYVSLELWPVDSEPNEFGIDFRPWADPTFALDHFLILRARQIRRASKRILRERRARLAEEQITGGLVGLLS